MPRLNSNNVKIYSQEEIDKIRIAAKIAYGALKRIEEYVKPGVDTLYLDELCNSFIIEKGGKSACFGYVMRKGIMPYPAYTCISVNHCLCHGIPSKDLILRKGDIVNIDITVEKDGFFGDTSRMYIVGDTLTKNKNLIDITYKSMMEGINAAVVGNYIGDIGKAIEGFVKKNSTYVVERNFVGHGIGDDFHGMPNVYHHDEGVKTPKIENGMCFTIEPIIKERDERTFATSEGWQVFTRGRVLSAQYEHTVAIVDGKACILSTL
ncbi:MAG: type I methionyl aminopeptidase [Pseudomonadota bacterium]